MTAHSATSDETIARLVDRILADPRVRESLIQQQAQALTEQENEIVQAATQRALASMSTNEFRRLAVEKFTNSPGAFPTRRGH